MLGGTASLRGTVLGGTASLRGAVLGGTASHRGRHRLGAQRRTGDVIALGHSVAWPVVGLNIGSRMHRFGLACAVAEDRGSRGVVVGGGGSSFFLNLVRMVDWVALWDQSQH